MLYVNDNYYTQNYFERCYRKFEQHPILGNCQGKRFTACLADPALWLALCLYTKSRGASVFPLPADTPWEAARRRAQKSRSHFLLFGGNIDEVLANIEVVTEREDDAEAVLVQMSSGTAGEPKFIERTWSSIDTEIENYVLHFEEAENMTPVVACPISHSYGLICGVLVALKRNIAPILVQNLNPKYIIRKLQEAKSPILYSSPALITTITMLIREDDPVHAIMTSGTLMQAAWFERVAKKKAVYLYQQYGCSETGCITLGGGVASVNDVGIPLPHLKVEAGTRETPSEIIVTMPDGNRVATHDLGYVDGAGRLHFLSRIDDMINVAGLNVYPTEVEEVVLDLPSVRDAVVFKRNHGFSNDQVCLQYVSDTELQPEVIREWCRHQLASYQVPINIAQVKQIDRLPNGKVSRKKLAGASA